MQAEHPAGVSPEEVAQFDALAARWWDPDGPMRPLHRMNPLRISWIETRILARFPRPVTLLDVGCGAGLAAEALARRGHRVIGIDAAAEAIAAAEAHAAGQGLALSYRVATAEALVEEGARFEVITALEVIEHVPNPQAFLWALGRLLLPGGMLFVSTLNRTPRAFLEAKLVAEYLLRWLPVGTHDWRRFIIPAELGGALRMAGLRITDIAGMGFDPLRQRWAARRDVSVNYIVQAVKG